MMIIEKNLFSLFHYWFLPILFMEFYLLQNEVHSRIFNCTSYFTIIRVNFQDLSQYQNIFYVILFCMFLPTKKNLLFKHPKNLKRTNLIKLLFLRSIFYLDFFSKSIWKFWISFRISTMKQKVSRPSYAFISCIL